MIEKVLHELGLGNKEETIYKAILEHGKIAPALLSRLTKINRTTVYSVAKELKNKGLIIEDGIGRTTYYSLARNADLEKVLESEKEKLSQKEKSVRELQEFLKNIPESKTYSVPKIKFIEEQDIENYLYEALPKWYKSMLEVDGTWWGFQDHTVVELFEKWIDWGWKKASKDIKLRVFTNESDIEEKMKLKEYSDRRLLRFLEGKNFTASQLVGGSYVLFLVTKQRPYYMVEIHDSVIAHNVRELFKDIWEKTK